LLQSNDPVVSVLQLAARLAPLPPPNPRLLAAARHDSDVRLFGNALAVAPPEIELYTTYIRFFSGRRCANQSAIIGSCGDLPPVSCIVGIKLSTICFAAIGR